MAEELLINVTPMETRVALVESGVLQEVSIERSASRGIVGNIYCGRVVRVLPGMQAAFVDIGLERTSFIHMGDIQLPSTGNSEGEGAQLDIRSVLYEGQGLTVQVMKDPLGSKGARLSTRLSVSSRYLVYLPQGDHLGVSLRIDDEGERQRLRELVLGTRERGGYAAGSFIIRTAAEGVGEDELVADIRFLLQLWASVGRKLESINAPAVVHQDLPLALRTLRDLVRAPVQKIRVDSKEAFDAAVGFAREFVPEVVERMEHYAGERLLFNLYSTEDEIQKALSRKVALKSGGYIIIDQTEAMTTIDVNTGAFVGHRNPEETIFKTNLEAATALARQLRVRNLGGIIIIDFIDMRDSEHQRQVLRALERVLEKDRAKTTVSGVSELGLVQLTRRRTRESLEHILCEPCGTCQGRGTVKSAETVCYEIFREILREARAQENRNYLVLASQSVIDRLLDEESASVADLEEFSGATIRFQVESIYGQEQFDVILL